MNGLTRLNQTQLQFGRCISVEAECFQYRDHQGDVAITVQFLAPRYLFQSAEHCVAAPMIL